MSETPHDNLPPTGPAQLRRSTSDRVVAGVAGGLGEYFGVDPVLFRVLFGVTAFFGGVGVVGYLLAWALIPEPGSERSTFDGAAAWFARRNIPMWLPLAVVVVLAWSAIFSWWSPWPSAPIAVVIVLLIVVLQRNRTVQATPSGYPASGLTAETVADPPLMARQAPELPRRGFQRRRRARPVLLGTCLGIAVAIAVLAVCDAVGGIRLPVYFWVIGAIALTGLIVGIVLRRTPWSLTLLLPWPLICLIAFGNTGASLHDGIGQRVSAPTSAAALEGSYRQGFGQLVLDLRGVEPLSEPRTVDITMAAGNVKIILPPTLNAAVHSQIRFGNVELDGASTGNSGSGVNVELPPPARATGASLTVDVHLADGQVTVEHG